jgi:uncharacterized membrane protein HdeD (DUF308 family)
MLNFFSGMAAGGFLIAALFFFRFWRKIKDSLFCYFGIAFVLFAIAQTASLYIDAPQDDRTWIYLLRLAGFILLLIAIIGKNMGKRIT